MIYKLMPRVQVRWHDVWLGAVVTALLFTVGKFLIGLYIGKSGIASAFGAAGSLVVVFVWVYYSAQIFLLGAEFTWVYASARSARCARSTAPSTRRGARRADAQRLARRRGRRLDLAALQRHITAPIGHGTNSCSPKPSSSLLVVVARGGAQDLLEDALAHLVDRLRRRR